MTRSLTNRRAAVAAAAALAFGLAAPAAGARPIDPGVTYSFLAASPAAVSPARAESTASRAGGGISDWGYLAIGSGAGSLVLIGAGGTRALTRRRRRHQAAVQPRVAG
jgi:hypothetical protein